MPDVIIGAIGQRPFALLVGVFHRDISRGLRINLGSYLLVQRDGALAYEASNKPVCPGLSSGKR
jgi:hypothetical protein